MFKKILCLALALICVASMAVIGVSAADTKVYFEVPSDWKNYKSVFCHIWVYGGDSLASWQSKKEKCTLEDDGRYSYDPSKVGGLTDGEYYGVIFSNDIGQQTYDTLMSTACFGDTLYCDGTTYENPQDSSKTGLAAFWKGQDRAQYGPIMQVTSIGNLIGTCMAPTTTADGMFTDFLNDWLESARTYSGKDDQAIIDDVAKGLGLSKDTTEKLIKESGLEIAWDKTASALTDATTEIAPNSGSVSTGRETTIVVVALSMMFAAAGVIFFARKKVSE